MRASFVIAAFAGLVLATALVAYFGVGDVGDALAAAGWPALFAVCAIHAAPLLLCAIAWRILARPPSPSLAECVGARWLREAVGNLLGVLPVAGEIAGARFLALRGVPSMRAAASVVADLTTESAAQIFFTFIGLAIVSIELSSEEATPWLLVGAVATLPVAAAPLVARSRRILLALEDLAARVGVLLDLPKREGGETLADAVHAIFRDRAAVAGSVLLHLVAWIGAAAESWAVFALAGRPLLFVQAVALEALVYAVRGAVFVVPSAIGIQEGGYVLAGALFGLSPETALALSLIKRARDLALGVPALLFWQLAEGRQLRRRRIGRPGWAG